MNKFKFAFQAFALVGLFFAFSAIANAQATRTWVSGVGDDVNPCSRTAPCKTFAGAISKTATNGEISCLDPGGFGAVTITKSITIDCEDTQGSILASGTTGVTMNGVGINVRLRGLSINGSSTGTNAIRVLNNGNSRLTLEEVIIDGFTTHGISLENNGGTMKLIVKDSSIRNVTNNGINTFLTGGGTATISVQNTLIAYTLIGVNTGIWSKNRPFKFKNNQQQYGCAGNLLGDGYQRLCDIAQYGNGCRWRRRCDRYNRQQYDNL